MIVRGLALLFTLIGSLWGRGVRVEFDPRNPAVGPFPSDFLTIPDAGQRTGVRVNLPGGYCLQPTSACREIALLNQLDGFNIQARMTVKFSGTIDSNTLRDGIFYVWL